MVHHFLASPFTDAARAEQFAAMRAALQADATADALLLGNLVLEDGAASLDAVVVRPHGITLVVLVPRGGRLSIPALGYGSWQLDGNPLAGADEFDNPFEQFLQQKAALEAWLQPRFTPAQANLRFISGLVLFGAPVAFSADVEAGLNEAPVNFQLLSDSADLPRRLRQLATPEIDLTPADLSEWADEWTAFAAAPAVVETASIPVAAAEAGAPTAAAATRPNAPEASAATGFLGQKAKALWGWLGANDVPDDDPPYGYDTAAARREEKEHLEQIRQQMQADVAAQLQALETREAERERSIAQLRAELAQAPPVAAEATALVSRLGAETREKAALEAEMEASRAESAARNQALDAKIQQLGQLIEQFSAAPAVMPAAPAAAVAPVVTAAPAAPVSATISEVVAPGVEPTVAVGPAAPQLAATSVVATPVAAAPIAAPVAATPLVAPVAPAPAATSAPPATPPRPVAPVAEAPRPAAAPSANEPSGPVPALLAEKFQELISRVRTAGPGLLPWLRQAAAGVQARPKVALAAVGVVVLGLIIWGLSQRGSNPPVPYQENGRWGYADPKGQPVIPATFTAAEPFQNGRAVVAKDGAYGFVDEAGKEVVSPAYDALNPYAGGYARARVGDAYTFVDEKGEELDAYYFNALDFAEGHAAVLDHRGWHYISGPTEPDKPVIFSEAYAFVDGLARVKLADGYTYITPKYLADPSAGTKPFGRYALAADFADGKARVTQDGRSFVIDKDGDEVK